MSNHIDSGKNLEKENRELRQQLNTLLNFINTATDGIVFVQEGLIQYVNESAAKLVGHSPEELIGTSFERFIHPDDLKTVKEAYKKRLKGEKIPSRYELRIKGPEDKIIYVEVNSDIVEYQGKPATITILRDITERKKLIEKVKEEALFFESLFENSPEAVALLDNSGHVIRINKEFEKMFGYKINEIKGNLLDPFVARGNLLKEAKQIRKRTSRGEKVELETIRVKKDGSLFNVHIIESLIKSRDKIIGKYVIYRDISARKEAENNLKESEKRYRELVEWAKTGIIIDDKEGHIVYANKHLAQIFGYESINELKNLTIYDYVHPDDREKVIDYHRRRISGKKAPSRYEFKGIRKDGKSLYLEVAVSSIVTEEGIIGTRSYIWDITERKNTGAALVESEKKFRSIVENSSEGIGIIDDNFRMIYCNDELVRMSGYSRQEIIGQDFRKFLDKESKELIVDCYIRKQRGEKISPRYEIVIVRKDGSKIMTELSSSVIKDSVGKIRTIVQLLDITQRKRAEEEMHQTMKRLRKILNATIKAITLTVEARDPFTSGHQRRVSDLARSIATEMKLPKDTIEAIRTAGVIHDLGKICIPAEILTKPAKLNEDEFKLIKAHPKVAYDILKEIEFPWPVAQIILQHHERLDGSGYPQGLKNDEILLEARILAVADVVEAMASHRPYRPALGIEKALEEISKNKGILYDSRVVEVCLRLFREKNYTFK